MGYKRIIQRCKAWPITPECLKSLIELLIIYIWMAVFSKLKKIKKSEVEVFLELSRLDTLDQCWLRIVAVVILNCAQPTSQLTLSILNSFPILHRFEARIAHAIPSFKWKKNTDIWKNPLCGFPILQR